MVLHTAPQPPLTTCQLAVALSLFLFKNVDIRNQRGFAICHTTSVWESLDSNLLLFTFFYLEEPTSPPLGPLFSDPMVSSVFLGSS